MVINFIQATQCKNPHFQGIIAMAVILQGTHHLCRPDLDWSQFCDLLKDLPAMDDKLTALEALESIISALGM